MTQGMLHSDFGYRFKIGDILVHVADWHDVITIMQRFNDVDSDIDYYWIRDERGIRSILKSSYVEQNYKPAP